MFIVYLIVHFLAKTAYLWFQQENGWVGLSPTMVGGKRSLSGTTTDTSNKLIGILYFDQYFQQLK